MICRRMPKMRQCGAARRAADRQTVVSTRPDLAGRRSHAAGAGDCDPPLIRRPPDDGAFRYHATAKDLPLTGCPAGLCSPHDDAHAGRTRRLLIFTFTYATPAAKSRRAETVLIPLLDVLQSVPVLGYLSFTVVFFVSLFPGTSL
jgi:hypothetical protein